MTSEDVGVKERVRKGTRTQGKGMPGKQRLLAVCICCDAAGNTNVSGGHMERSPRTYLAISWNVYSESRKKEMLG